MATERLFIIVYFRSINKILLAIIKQTVSFLTFLHHENKKQVEMKIKMHSILILLK